MPPIDLLRVRNETFVDAIFYHDSLPSTNHSALELLAETALTMPALVIAETQTAGRGRGGNLWWSSSGSLTCSLIIDGSLWTPENIGRVSLTTGLAICQSIERFAMRGDLSIKWPNDVYLEGKKVCGILIERQLNHPGIVIGFGINVNNSMHDAPGPIRQVATSLRDQLQEELDRTALLIECLQQMERRFRELSEDPSEVWEQWRAYCFLTGRHVQVITPEREVQGTCHGIREDGALLVYTSSGLVPCLAGVVEWRG